MCTRYELPPGILKNLVIFWYPEDFTECPHDYIYLSEVLRNKHYVVADRNNKVYEYFGDGFRLFNMYCKRKATKATHEEWLQFYEYYRTLCAKTSRRRTS